MVVVVVVVMIMMNLSSEELELEIGEEGLFIRDESRGGDIPSGVGPLKLNEPLIRCHTVRANGLEGFLNGTKICPDQLLTQEIESYGVENAVGESSADRSQENPAFVAWKRATKVTGIEMLIGVVTMEEEVALAEVFQGKEGVIRIMVAIGTMEE
ncbi:hypothetical protein WN944_029244 [Citrus x changshan-huyou]|uniref:Uncharacterized protein n=1 Tax=Citrus x changshan-huyou TaxID=2935761 RepID=A0AAP0LLR2_9ROSI